MASAIQTEGLTKEFVSVSNARMTVALKDLTLQVEEGEIFGFLGPNGAGKTTTIKILLGLIFPTAGRAWVLGKDLWDT
ncbi:MAG: ATP-binding cassette domain-containing protein, partial [Armatimonadetes bacterium]|nr:ATP-binding cassette domain-containing protein [Armatimonadota bacterium]